MANGIMVNLAPEVLEYLLDVFEIDGENDLTDKEKVALAEVWFEHPGDYDLLNKKVGELNEEEGNSDPKSRYRRVQVLTEYKSGASPEEKIVAIRDYLAGPLYSPAYFWSIHDEGNREKAEIKHRADMMFCLAAQYRVIRDCSNAVDIYKKIIEIKPGDLMAYRSLADCYRIYYKDIDAAIEVYECAKKLPKYYEDEEFRDAVDSEVEYLEKKKNGISRHVFSFYDTYPPASDENFMAVKERYKDVFEEHRRYIEKLENLEFESKNKKTNIGDSLEYKKYCEMDIDLYPRIAEYYDEINQLGYGFRMAYEDNGNSRFSGFNRLINYYMKRKEYNKAVEVCKKAIDYGMEDYNSSKTMQEKMDELNERLHR